MFQNAPALCAGIRPMALCRNPTDGFVPESDRWLWCRNPTDGFVLESHRWLCAEIPPTSVGGLFSSNLRVFVGTFESHQR